jgi:hypothetical protein
LSLKVIRLNWPRGYGTAATIQSQRSRIQIIIIISEF